MNKLVLVVVDALKPAMLERAIAENRAPVFAEILRRGSYTPECVSTFPSVTPVASATITTGVGVGEHNIPGSNWFHRGEARYIEYGSSLQSSRAFGLFRTLTDIVYNMNFEHLSRGVPTLFETLEDNGVRCAVTPYLVYRGRSRHEPALTGWMRRAAQAANFRHPIYGPSELFYGELFTSRDIDCPATLARPGTRDPYSACVGEYLERHDLYDFLLFSLPDNDHHSHSHGPQATIDSIARADRYLAKLMDAGGGIDKFLSDRALILMADHAQTPVTHHLPLWQALGEDWHVLQPNDEQPETAQLAVCPGARAAMIYLLQEADDRTKAIREVVAKARKIEGVELLAWREAEQAVVVTEHGELRFCPGSQLADGRGRRWDIDGSQATLELEAADGLLDSRAYPDGLGRLWSLLESEGAGEIVISAALGYELVDWGGADHVTGGSHGSLRRGDSLAPLALVNCGRDLQQDRQNGVVRASIEDVAPIVLEHFGLATHAA